MHVSGLLVLVVPQCLALCGLTPSQCRIETIEMFDEYEEWHLILGHYCIVLAALHPTGTDHESHSDLCAVGFLNSQLDGVSSAHFPHSQSEAVPPSVSGAPPPRPARRPARERPAPPSLLARHKPLSPEDEEAPHAPHEQDSPVGRSRAATHFPNK